MAKPPIFTKDDIQIHFDRAVLLIQYRGYMKLLSKVMAEMLGLTRGTYSNMERHKEPVTNEVLKNAEKFFVEWRKAEIKRLQEKISELNNIPPKIESTNQ